MFGQLGPVPQLGRGLLNRGSRVQYLESDQYSGSTRGQSYCLPLQSNMTLLGLDDLNKLHLTLKQGHQIRGQPHMSVLKK